MTLEEEHKEVFNSLCNFVLVLIKNLKQMTKFSNVFCILNYLLYYSLYFIYT